MSRFVIIDDTNPSIQYSGPWFEATNTSNTLPQIVAGSDTVGFVDNGPPFQNTLHGVNLTASLSFNFNGSAVIVYGTSITTNASGTQDPTWECFIDNTSIGSSPPSSVVPLDGVAKSENNWILCGAGPAQLQDGPHLLTVNASVSRQTFWFDQIQYAPSASVSLNRSLLRIDSSDSAIQYSPPGGSWSIMDQPTNYTSSDAFGISSSTQINGAFLTYEFSGTSISLFGSAAADSNFDAAYTIDDQEPIPFEITYSVGNTTSVLYNQMFFESGQLSPGQHKLVVTYLGNNNMQPINVNYFVQVQQDAPSSTSSITPSTSVSSGSSSNSSLGKPTEAIIGGVIGGLVLISLLIALFFFLRRHNNRRSNTIPSPDVVNPSTVSVLSPSSAFLPQSYTSNGQSLPSQSISNKFSHWNQPSDFASTSNSGGIPPFTPLRPQVSSPKDVRLSPSSPHLPLIGSQTNLDGARVPVATTEPSIQRSSSPQDATATFVRHEDSGVRIPSAEENVVELPPLYTPG